MTRTLPADQLGITTMPLVDHHCHGVVSADLDRPAFEALLSEAGPPPPGQSNFRTQLGYLVRRHCAPMLDLEPHTAPDQYLARRASLGAEEVNRRFLQATGIAEFLVDTGFQPGGLLTPAALAQAASGSGSLTPPRAHEIVRLEQVAEDLARDGTTAAGFAADFAAALRRRSAGAVGLKSVIAYRHGLGFDPAPPGAGEVARAAGRWLAAGAAGRFRLDDPVLLRHLLWTAVDTGLPLQFHVGFGDPDVRLHRADPSLMHDFLMAVQPSGVPIMLLHCYPYHRAAGYLAASFPHVYMDLGLTLNYSGMRAAAILAESLELGPLEKFLFSSDAYGLAELYYLGALQFRAALGQVLGRWTEDGMWTPADARRSAQMMGSGIARRVYALDAG